MNSMNAGDVVNSSELAAGLAQRDIMALETFHSVYKERILAVARRMVRDEWDAEEVFQDVLWTVYRKADSFRGDSDLWPWVRRVTHNASLMLLRKRRRAPMPIEDSDIEAIIGSEPTADIGTRTEEVAKGKQAAERMGDELDRQDPTNRHLFVRMEVDGASKEEVSEELGLSISAVKARLHRVRKALRDAADGPRV